MEYVDLMKIEIGGYEVKVLRGCKGIPYERLVGRFIVEVHVDQVKTSEVIEHSLENLGTKLWE